MELKPGYKQTIPEDWELHKIQSLISEGVLHKPVDGNHGEIHPKSDDFVESGIPFIMANNVQNGTLDLKNCSFIRKNQADGLRKGFAKTGDVLLTHKATIGNTAIVGKLEDDYIMLTPQVTYYRVNDHTKLNNHYLRHFFDSNFFQVTLELLSGGGTRSYIGIVSQEQLPVLLPSSVNEQEAIAGALSDADELIASLEQLIEKKRMIKQGAMQELLTGKKRLPGFQQKPGYKQTEVGEIPEDWIVVNAGKIGYFKGGNGFPIFYQGLNSGKYPFFKVSDMNKKGNTIYLSQSKNYISEATRRSLGANTFPPDTIVFAKVGAAIFLERKKILNKESCLDNNLAGFVISDYNTSHHYIHHYLLNFRLGSLVSTTALPSLNGTVLKAVQMPLPPTKREQEAIATVLSDMDTEIEALEEKLEKARKIKAGMMHNLLTGTIRFV